MYEQIIESYYRDSDGESHYFVRGDRNMVVIPCFGTDECTLYETMKACFEEHVKPELEDRYDAEGLTITFSEEELDFMEKAYPDSTLAELIAEYRITKA